MNTEQQFIDLIKEGKVSDAMQMIKDTLTNMAGEAVVEQKFAIAEKLGMKKLVAEEKDDEDFEDDDEKKKPAKKDDEDKKDDDEEDKKKEEDDKE